MLSKARKIYWWIQGKLRERYAILMIKKSLRGGGPEVIVSYVATAGLCNRLRAHLAASEIAHRLGTKCVPVWAINMHCRAEFTDIFVDHGMRSTLRSVRIITPQNVSSVSGSPSSALYVLGEEWQYLTLDKIEHLLGSKALLRHLPRPNSRVEMYVEKKLKRVGSFDVVVHIRRGDFVSHTKQAKNFEYYISAVNQLGIDFRSIGVISDGSADELNGFLQAKAAILISGSDVTGRSVENVIDAWADIECAVSAVRFIGTPKSSLSELIIKLREDRGK